MSVGVTAATSRSKQETQVTEAVRSLAEALRGAPEFRELQGAARALNHDDIVQDLLHEIDAHQSALRRATRRTIAPRWRN